MEDIKKTIFTDVDVAMKIYLSDKEQFGEYHQFTELSHCRLCTLWGLIEDCKLEDEYQIWKENLNRIN